MAVTLNSSKNKESGKWVLLSFIAFFGVIIAVNAVFITAALDTHSGVVIEQPYEKGLAFNETLEKAKAQADIDHKVSYENGTLRLILPVSNAAVEASFLRPVKDGHDFKISLLHKGDGVYEATPQMPLPGAWTVRLKATWDNQIFQITHDLIAE